MRAPVLLLALAALSVALATPASALVVFPPEALVLEGDSAPGGDSFASFGAPAQNELGDVAFRAVLDDALSSRGVFLLDRGTDALSAIARQGDTAPETGGLQSYADFGTPDLNHDGEVVVFRAALAPLATNEGVFRSISGTVDAVALSGDSAHGSTESFATFLDPRISRSGNTVAFSAILDGGSTGIFTSSSGLVGNRVDSNDVAPGTSGHFVAFGQPDISDLFDLAFFGVVDEGGPGFAYGIFRYSVNEGDSLVARQGDPAPGGGSYDFGNGGDVALSLLPGGLLVFRDATRVFSYTASTGVVLEAELGSAAPGTGGSYADFVGRPGCCADDTHVFLADVAGGSTSAALFGDHAGPNGDVLVAVGDAAPDTGGGSFAGLPFAPSVRNFADAPTHAVSFSADVGGGSATSGVFQLPEPRGGLGLLAGGVLLGMLGRAHRRRCD